MAITKMEKARELSADIVSLLHISPAQNTDFKRITSHALQNLSDSATNVWKKLVKFPNRFHAVQTEALFGAFNTNAFPKLTYWNAYVTARYPWVNNFLSDSLS